MRGNVFAVTGLLGTAIVHTCRDFFAENKIPLITAYGNTRMWVDYPKNKLRYIFIAYPDYEDEAEFLAIYAIKNIGAKKLALFYQNDDYGKMGMQGIKNALSKMPGKASLVSTVPYEVTERALSAHALKLKESGADTIFLYTTMTHGALILKEMAKVGYRPKALASFPLGDPIMYKIAGEVWEGVYPAGAGNSGIPGSDPEADRVADILKKYNPKIAGKEYLGVFGAVSMIYTVEALKRAGRDLTPEKMIKAMESIKNWKPEGVGAPATFGPDRHHGVNASRVLHAKDGKHIPVTGFKVFKPRF
jgi:ABC-type branched-subunit amino acid transport system substrate-binding protein